MNLKDMVMHDIYFYNYDIFRNCIDDKIPLSEAGKAAAGVVDDLNKAIEDIAPKCSRSICDSKLVNAIIDRYSVVAFYLSGCRCLGGFPVSHFKGVDFEFDYFDQLSLIDESCEGFFANLRSILDKRCFPEFHKWTFLWSVLAIASILIMPMSIFTEIFMVLAVISQFYGYYDDIVNKPLEYLHYFSCIALFGVVVLYFVGSDNVRPADMETFLLVRTMGLISNSLLALFVLAEYLLMVCKKQKNKKFEKEFVDYFEENYLLMVHFIDYHKIWWKYERGNAESPKRLNMLIDEYDKMLKLYHAFSDKKS